MKEQHETHRFGSISIENVPAELRGGDPGEKDDYRVMQADFGIQIAKDGRVWVCINGIAFLRFSPHPDGKMSKGS
jgi:hypothetical protein